HGRCRLNAAQRSGREHPLGTRRGTPMKVWEILRSKGTTVHSIGPDATVHEAVQALNHHQVGALIVMGKSREILGIFTDRDVLRRCLKDGKPDLSCPVAAVMTTQVIVGIVDDEVGYAMGIMTQNRIRHMPVMEGTSLAGMISLGDLVKSQLQETD